MPPKSAKNSKRSGKSNKCTSEPCVPSKTTTDANSTSGLNPEVEDQFELELCWCIQQLETSLANGKLQEKQMQDLNKHVRSLKSNTAPLIKKRQIMRNMLGDYKDKMAKDEMKLSKTVSSVKFTNPAAVNKKSVFIKKATRYNEQEHQEQTDDLRTQETLVSAKRIINIDRTQTPFRFNFQTCQ
ncbi:PREDICTED: UPF0488 protein CG14286 [Dinoponera quadriceps]|uniref:UPF0488 protein CG14286 n=1 Tax=Dinoponera quadriceps TaxID=609295 RepID=A0A6P3WQ69_DINQU|nr:PREDICTED: UPF0488 protein CG14286 [Dinoponera quadriceps]XP_014468264.1 PREDICTED: UPF0488 protein CG14286 [Dinoponera quadriceps]XP_014468265.1 PREDICTED: UPF0488 protein CG14286 [Dinoponera quadriceps]